MGVRLWRGASSTCGGRGGGSGTKIKFVYLKSASNLMSCAMEGVHSSDPKGPSTANHQPPPANRHQPPVGTNRQPPTTANSHQPPIPNHQLPPTTANRHQPPVANRQLPTAHRQHIVFPRAILGKLCNGTIFFLPLRTALVQSLLGGGGVEQGESTKGRTCNVARFTSIRSRPHTRTPRDPGVGGDRRPGGGGGGAGQGVCVDKGMPARCPRALRLVPRTKGAGKPGWPCSTCAAERRTTLLGVWDAPMGQSPVKRWCHCVGGYEMGSGCAVDGVCVSPRKPVIWSTVRACVVACSASRTALHAITFG